MLWYAMLCYDNQPRAPGSKQECKRRILMRREDLEQRQIFFSFFFSVCTAVS